MPVYDTVEAPADYKGDVLKPFALIPEGTKLDAIVTEVKEDVKPFNDRETGLPVVKLAYTFATHYDDQDRNVWGETGTEFIPHPDCTFYNWAQEILGQDLPQGFRLNTDHLINQPCRVVIGVRSYTKKGATEKTTVNFVRDVLRASGGTQGASPAPVEDPF